MTGDRETIRDEDIHAFIDGELDEARQAEIAWRIETDKPLAARVAAFRADKAALAAAYEELALRPLPASWLVQVAHGGTAMPQRSTSSWRFAWPMAAVLALAVGFGGFTLLDPGPKDRIIADALSARSGGIEAVNTVPAASVETPEARNRILSAALGMTVKVPDLARFDFRLASLKFFSGHAVELSYRDSQDRTFTLYLRPSDGTERFDQFQRDRLRVCIWQDDVLGAVMSGPISAAEMLRMAATAYAGLTA